MILGLQSKYSGSIPVLVGCQKDSGTTVENGTQVIPVLLAVFRFAVYGRTTCGIFNWGIQNLLNFYMKVDPVEEKFNIL